MVLGYLFSYIYVFIILLIAAVAEKKQLLGQEGRRKLVHILLVFTWLIMLKYLKGTIHMIVIPLSFVILNLLSYLKAKKDDGSNIPILSGMERKGVEETPGTVYYALSIMIMGGFSLLNEEWVIPCGMGLFCMAFGDGMAGIVGKHVSGIFANHITSEKSLGGSIACFVFSILGCVLLLMFTKQEIVLLKMFIMGVTCMLLELPGKGIDNLTVPFGCMTMAILLL